jgi:predicted transcriptional regulator
MDFSENAVSLTTTIVSKYVSRHKVATSELSSLISAVHQAISRLGQPPAPEEMRTPAVPVGRSVRRDYVICLDCGYRGKTLRRHINVQHGLSPAEYRQRWDLKSTHALTAPAYSEQRSSLARELGLGRRAAAAAPSKASTPAAAKSEVQSTAKRRPRARRAAKPAMAGDGVPAPARKRSPRSRTVAASPPEPANSSPSGS